MNRLQVSSSDLKSVGYDALSSTLEIEFQDDNVYQYFDVGMYIFDGLMGSASKGKYFKDNIKDQFTYTQITSEQQV